MGIGLENRRPLELKERREDERDVSFGKLRKGRKEVRKLLLVLCLLAMVSGIAIARKGTWFDEVVFFVEDDQPKLLSMMESGDANFYPNNFDGVHQPLIEEKGLPYKVAYGGSREILLNPEGPFFDDGRWNPFDDLTIQLALNRLVDNQLLIDEYAFGLGVAMYSCLSPIDPVYAEIPDAARANAIKYGYDEVGALDMISTRMPELGAELINGTWHHANEDGDVEEIVIIGLIRPEDTRREIGDYFADKLETAGFKVDRQYKLSAEASPLWITSPGEAGLFHFYTGGWGASGIDREYQWPYAGHYTDVGWPTPRTRGYPNEIDPAMYDAAVKIINGNFATVEERLQLLRLCEEGVGNYPWHIWLYAEAGSWVHTPDVDVTADLMAGYSGRIWPLTMRFVDEDGAPVVGGTIRFANQSFLTQPWNAPHGSNWLYDAAIQRGAEDTPTFGNPFTGLAVPHFLESANVAVKRGLPVRVTETDWCTLDFVDENVVPTAAWADWDAANEVFTTVGTVYPDGVTSDIKLRLTYPSELWTWKWHDGSTIHIADMLMGLIYGFPLDPAKPESPYFDADQVPQYDSSMSVFRGIQIINTDPLVVDIWVNGISLDAETVVLNYDEVFWFTYSQGIAPWHTMALGLMAEAAGTGAFSSGKADREEVDRLNYAAGVQLEDLKGYLTQAIAENFIPYGGTLRQYLTLGQVAERYANLQAFVDTYDHMWVGTGPMMIKSFDPLASIVVGVRYADYPIDLEKYLVYAAPKLADVDVTGDATVAVGSAGTFTVAITADGEAYPLSELLSLSYVVIDSLGEIAFTGAGAFTADGLGTITLSADQTAGLTEGSSSLEVIVAVTPVVIPATGSISFVVTE